MSVTIFFLQFSLRFIVYYLDDYFEEVKQKKSIYKEYFVPFLMDQQKKQYKAVLEDGEFSDEVIFNKFSY